MDRLLTLQRRFRVTLVIAVAALLATALACGDGSDNPAPSPSPTAEVTSSATPSPAAASTPSSVPTAVPTRHPPSSGPGPLGPATATVEPQDTPASAPAPSGLSLLTVVDKQTALPSGYVPSDLTPIGGAYIAPGFSGSLRAEAAQALTRMLSDAYAAGNDIYARSAYRSYSEQAATFAYWVSVLGEAEARRVSAEPGHSEHQLGTAVDLTDATVGYDLVESFGATASGQWLMAHAHTYGFALSYPACCEATTGYAYEPWHWRYIGPDPASAWKASGLTLVEYLRGIG